MSEDACVKCGGSEIRMVYHRPGCGREKCSCVTCWEGSNETRHDEHLHFHCQTCRFDWTGDVLDGSLSAATAETPCASQFPRPEMQEIGRSPK